MHGHAMYSLNPPSDFFHHPPFRCTRILINRLPFLVGMIMPKETARWVGKSVRLARPFVRSVHGVGRSVMAARYGMGWDGYVSES